MLRVVPAEPHHAAQMLRKGIRQPDIDEWVAASGLPVERLLARFEWHRSDHGTHALLNEDGECICMWGVQLAADGVGAVWLLATNEAQSRRRAIHRLWREEIAWMHTFSDELQALAYSQNILHHRWLTAVGFERIAVVKVNAFGPPFYLYQRFA